MSAISDGGSLEVERITAELARCRQRGLEKLDLDDQRQRPVVAPELDKLADDYCARRPGAARAARRQRVKILLSEALKEYEAHENEEDASLLHDLFFSDSTLTVRKSAGLLLREARQSLNEPSEKLFRDRFQAAFSYFAEFLIRFVAAATDRNDAPAELTGPRDVGIQLQVTAGLIGSTPDRFIDLLAQATEATIVGFENELLEGALRAALEAKRDRENDRGAFWDSLEIVFLSEPLLDYLDDRAVSPDRRVAVRERRRTMTATRRLVRLLLRSTGCTGWTVSDLPFMPPVTGSLFVVPGPRHVVQLIVRQPAPRSGTDNNLYFEFDDLPNEYFTKAFRRVVDRSITDNRPVPVGNPFGSTFVRTETVYREQVLRPDSGSENWLPMVLIVTTQRKFGKVAPVLQLRTEVNAVRELNTVSHLSRHIYQEETSPLPGARPISAPASFDAKSDCALRAAHLRVQIETGYDTPPDIHELATGRYVNPTTDSLFFFVYSLELPDEMKLWPKSDMYHFTLAELLDIRSHQALRVAYQLCQVVDRPARFWETAIELAALNLALHGHGDLGERLNRLAGRRPAAMAEVSADIERLVRSTSPSWASSGRDIKIVGLSGWQYREFFTVLLPQYAKVGVPGARDELRRISTSAIKTMLQRASSLYQDEDLLRSMPIEL
jgi:hypothetical protein